MRTIFIKNGYMNKYFIILNIINIHRYITFNMINYFKISAKYEVTC